jgi:hypothetical protein
MNKKIFLTASLILFGSITSGQQSSEWDKWNWLIGEWIGEGSGQPGQGKGTFSFSFDLDKNIIIRKSHSDYPPTDTKPLILHDDLMIIYYDSVRNPNKAVYFDNESHTIFYTATFSEKTITLISSKSTNVPIFRLIYSMIDTETVNTRFEMSQDGVKFMTYIEGKSKRIKPSH